MGNSKPLAACIVMIRTASSSASGVVTSVMRVPSSCWISAHCRNVFRVRGAVPGFVSADILQLLGLLTEEPAAAPNLPGAAFGKVQLLKAHFAYKAGYKPGHSCGLAQLVIDA